MKISKRSTLFIHAIMIALPSWGIRAAWLSLALGATGATAWGAGSQKNAEILRLDPFIYHDFESHSPEPWMEGLGKTSMLVWRDTNRPDIIPGVSGNAYDFSPNNASFLSYSHGNFKVGNLVRSTGVSISFWINLDFDYARDNHDRLIDHEGLFDIRTSAGGLMFRDQFVGGDYVISNRVLDGQWHHVVVSIDYRSASNNIQCYVDNVKVNAYSKDFSNIKSRSDSRKVIRIGARYNVAGSYSSAKIDEFAAFNRPITDFEINQLYALDSLMEPEPTETTLEINDGKTITLTGASASAKLTAVTPLTGLNSMHWEVVAGNGSLSSNGGISNQITLNDGKDYQYAKVRLTVSNNQHQKSGFINVVRVKQKAPGARTLSAVPAPGIHPRVLFSPEDLPDMRNRYSSVGYTQSFIAQRKAAYEAVPISERTQNHYSFLSYVALMENDAVRLRSLSEDLAAFAASNMSSAVDYTSRYSVNVNPGIALAYDFLHNSMTVAERDVVRRFISLSMRHKFIYGGYIEGAREDIFQFSNNFTSFTCLQVIAAAAIEGEEGEQPEMLAMSEDVLRNFLCRYGITEAGFPREGYGYFAFGMQNAAISCLIHARRGENFFETSRLYKALRSGFYEQQPWELGNMYSHHDGQIFETGGVTGRMFYIAKYLFPNDAMVDYHVQSFIKWRSRGFGNNNAYFLAFAMNPMEGNVDPGSLGQRLNLPTTMKDLSRGIVNTRNKWGHDMVRFDFECRMDFYNFGHMHSDRNSFTLSGHGRQWIADSNYHATRSDYHSTILIDGIASDCHNRPLWPSAPGVLLRYEDNDEFMISQGDATFFYNYGPTERFASQSRADSEGLSLVNTGKTWGDFSYRRDLVPEPARNRPIGNSLKIEDVEKAIRSVVFKKGDYPFALIVDDMKKDNNPHEYEWVANLTRNDVHYPPHSNGFHYDILSQSAEEMVLKYTVDTGPDAPQLKICVLDAAGTPQNIQAGERSANGVTLNAISIKRDNVVEPHFKVLLYPHRAGSPQPAFSWSDDRSLLTVMIGDEITILRFSKDEADRTRVDVLDTLATVGITKFQYDFGTNRSAIEPGWIRVTPETNTEWMHWSGGAIDADDQGLNDTENKLNRDIIWGHQPATLNHKVENGIWRVALVMGERDTNHWGMWANAEGHRFGSPPNVGSINTAAGEFKYANAEGGSVAPSYFDVEVTDGELNLEIEKNASRHWAISQLTLTKISSRVDVDPAAILYRYDFGPEGSPQEPGWTSISPQVYGDVYWSGGLIEAADQGSTPTIQHLNRDLIWGHQPATLNHKVENGIWRVALVMGERDTNHWGMWANAEGHRFGSPPNVGSINTAVGEFKYANAEGGSVAPSYFDVEVTDGELNLEIEKNASRHWAISQLTLSRVLNVDGDGNGQMDGIDVFLGKSDGVQNTLPNIVRNLDGSYSWSLDYNAMSGLDWAIQTSDDLVNWVEYTKAQTNNIQVDVPSSKIHFSMPPVQHGLQKRMFFRLRVSEVAN